tara:strand:+ start:362 stop:541 length:180 start_codon:yes stop_codon:yes gene_type:complete
MWDFEELEKEDVIKVICWACIIIFGIIGILYIVPYLSYIIIVLGISVPTYFLIKNKKQK